MIVRGPALVETMARRRRRPWRATSRLTEILFGETLKASADARTAHPNPPAGAPDHAKLLNAAEKRLITEWMDLGGQYFNDPFDGGIVRHQHAEPGHLRSAGAAGPASTCAGCHQADRQHRPASSHAARGSNRFVLTGSAEGDYNVTLSMISDTCNAGHQLPAEPAVDGAAPGRRHGQTTAVLPAGSANYNAIASWIATGCPTP